MSRSTLNLLLLVAFLASLGLNWVVRPHPSRPNREFIPEMYRTARFNAFSPNPNFADGKTLQAPVAGTIPRGFPPLHFSASPEDAIRAGETLQNPLRQDAQPAGGAMGQSMMGRPMGMMGGGMGRVMGGMMGGIMQGGMPGVPGTMCCATPASPNTAKEEQGSARGAVVFATFCQPCHGPTGKGDGLVVLRGYPAPPPLGADHARQMPDGQIFHVLTYGQKNMPSYATQISREDRWNVIAFVRSLQAKPEVPAAGGHP